MGKKSRAIQFTRAEAEALMCLMSHARVGAIFPDATEKEAMREVYGSLPATARTRIVTGLNEKLWTVWADTHPEEGPFK